MQILFYTILLLMSNFFSTEPAKKAAQSRYLVVISMDGLSPAHYLEAERRGIQLPNLQRLMRTGVYSDGMQSVYPTLTYPSHASMVTGVLPKAHGIYANSYYFGEQLEPVISGKHYQIAPLWRLFPQHGLSTAGVFWPVTMDEEIDWLVPEVWWDADKGNDAVRLQKQAAVMTPGLLDSLHAYIGPPLQRYFESDTVKTDAAIYLLTRHRPNLLLLHYSHLDYMQHLHGVFSAEAIATLVMQDTQIGRLMEAAKSAGIAEQIAFMIVSDHGLAPIDSLIHPNVALAEAGLLDTLDGKIAAWRAVALPGGGACSLLLHDLDHQEALLKLRKVIDRLVALAGIERVFGAAQIDSLGGDPNAIFMLEAAPGYAFGGNVAGKLHTSAGGYRATHGYLPSKPEMRAGFIAAGEGIAANGNIGQHAILDLYATILAYFDIRAEPRAGKVIRAILADRETK